MDKPFNETGIIIRFLSSVLNSRASTFAEYILEKCFLIGLKYRQIFQLIFVVNFTLERKNPYWCKNRCASVHVANS